MAIDATGARATILRSLNTESKVKPAETSKTNDAKPSSAPGQASQTKEASENVSLTGMAQKLQSIEDNLSEIPVVDDDKVSSLREQISNGTYQINAERIADKMIEFDALF